MISSTTSWISELEIDEFAEMQESDMIEMILSAKKKKAIYEPINHTKTLIIISGNLDQAFNMAGQASEADVNALIREEGYFQVFGYDNVSFG
jgi:hypothetical protein